MSAQTEEERQKTYPEQKIKNHFLYCFRIFGKLFSLAFFGVGTVVLSVIFLPVFKLIFHPARRFRYHMRYVIYLLFNGFTRLMWAIGVIKVKVNKPEYLKNVRSAIVVANHPAYLDSVIMLAQLKHGVVIPKAELSKKSVMQVVINELYMPNSLPFSEITERAKEDLAEGNTLLIFPEGTRSTPYGQNHYKKGAVRISLATGVPIIPVYIGGTEKKGMGKGDKVLEFNPRHRYIYDLQIKEPLYPDEFKDLPNAIAAKRYTQKIKKILSDEENAQYRF